MDHTMPRAGVVVFGKNLTEPSKTMICVVRNEEQLAHPWREAREQSSGFTHPSGPADASDHNPVCTAIRHFEGSTGLSQNCLVIVASSTPSRDGSHFFPALWRGPTECTEWRPRADNARRRSQWVARWYHLDCLEKDGSALPGTIQTAKRCSVEIEERGWPTHGVEPRVPRFDVSHGFRSMYEPVIWLPDGTRVATMRPDIRRGDFLIHVAGCTLQSVHLPTYGRELEFSGRGFKAGDYLGPVHAIHEQFGHAGHEVSVLVPRAGANGARSAHIGAAQLVWVVVAKGALHSAIRIQCSHALEQFEHPLIDEPVIELWNREPRSAAWEPDLMTATLGGTHAAVREGRQR